MSLDTRKNGNQNEEASSAGSVVTLVRTSTTATKPSTSADNVVTDTVENTTQAAASATCAQLNLSEFRLIWIILMSIVQIYFVVIVFYARSTNCLYDSMKWYDISINRTVSVAYYIFHRILLCSHILKTHARTHQNCCYCCLRTVSDVSTVSIFFVYQIKKNTRQ